MVLKRSWAMPNKNTFAIPVVAAFIKPYIKHPSADPFANSCVLATVTNDLDPSFGTTFNMDALEFLQSQPDEIFHTVLFDPPWTPRQVSENYRQFGRTVNMKTTQASFWGKLRKEIARVTVIGGVCISAAYNSGGVGKKNGYEIEQIMLVAHGGWHNDTIITIDRKVR